MQVSWIDPEDVAALAESLRPSARPKPVVPEPVIEEPVEPLVPEQQPVAVSTAAAAESESATATPEMPNLAAFRQRLQSIREKAINAGLLTPQPAAPVAEPESGPETEAAPEPVTEVLAPVQPVEETETPSPVAETPAVIPEPVAAEETQPFPIEPAPAPVHEPEPEPAPPVFTSEPAPAPVATPEPSAPVYTYTPPQPEIAIAPGASVKERLDAFAEWATRKWSPNQLLVVDEFGDLLWGPTKKAGLVLSTMMAWNAAIRASAQAASGASQVLHQSLATGEALAVIPCQTRLGTLHLAVVKAQVPSDYEITCLRDSLVEVMDIPG